MSRQDKSPGEPSRFPWFLLGLSYGPRKVDEIKLELSKLEEYEPLPELNEEDRRKRQGEKELARTLLLDELRWAERVRKRPWLPVAHLIFWSVLVMTAILIWLLVRSGA